MSFLDPAYSANPSANEPFQPPAQKFLSESDYSTLEAISNFGNNGLSLLPYVVQPEDTPSTIAEEQLGNHTLWDTHIFEEDGSLITSEEARALEVGAELRLLSEFPVRSEQQQEINLPPGLTVENDPLLGNYITYKVKQGDTPSEIAEKELEDSSLWSTSLLQSDGTNITEEESRNLQVGEEIFIPTRQNSLLAGSYDSHKINPLAQQDERLYTVKQGDTPSEVAEKALGDASLWSTALWQSDGTNITEKEAMNLQVGEQLTLLSAEEALAQAVIGEIFERSTDFYKYKISEGDTPESIAHAVYGDATLASFIVTRTDFHSEEYAYFPVSNLSESTLRGGQVATSLSRLSAENVDKAMPFIKGIGEKIPFTGSSKEKALIYYQFRSVVGKAINSYLGQLTKSGGTALEDIVIGSMKSEGEKFLSYNQLPGGKGFDGLIKAPDGKVKVFEHKTIFGKEKSFDSSLGRAYPSQAEPRGYKQGSAGWTQAVAERSIKYNQGNPETLRDLERMAKNADDVAVIGAQTKKVGNNLQTTFLERKPGQSKFSKTGKVLDTLVPDDTPKTAVKGSSKAVKVIGPLGVAAGVAIDVHTLKTAYNADGGQVGDNFKRESAGIAGSWAGGAVGATIGSIAGSAVAGAAAGSVVPGFGTAAGFVVGAGIAVAGAYFGSKAGEKVYEKRDSIVDTIKFW
jgi:LysM repeat protein